MYVDGVDYVKNINASKFWRSKFLEISSEYPAYTFAISDTSRHHTEISRDFQVAVNSLRSDIPFVTARVGGRKFKMSEAEFSMDAVREFLVNLDGGHIDPVPEVVVEGDVSDHCYSVSHHNELLKSELQLTEKLLAEARAEIERLRRQIDAHEKS